MAETCTNIYEARNRATSVMQAGKSGGVIKNRVSIDDRPDMVDQKSRIGDWEGDTVIGKNHKGGLVTLAERKSRYVCWRAYTQQTCQWGNGGDNTLAESPQGQMPHHYIRQRQGACGA